MKISETISFMKLWTTAKYKNRELAVFYRFSSGVEENEKQVKIQHVRKKWMSIVPGSKNFKIFLNNF